MTVEEQLEHWIGQVQNAENRYERLIAVATCGRKDGPPKEVRELAKAEILKTMHGNNNPSVEINSGRGGMLSPHP